MLAHRYDGATFGSSQGRQALTKLNKNRIDSILFESLILLTQEGFFRMLPPA